MLATTAANAYEFWWLGEMAQAEMDRLATLRRRWDAYHGKHPDALKVRIGGPNDNVKVNLCRAVVDKGVSFLFGDEPGFELQSDGTTAPEEYLDAVWRANRKMLTFIKMAMSGGVTGDVFVRVYPNGARLNRQLPRAVILDAEIVFPTWDQDDVDNVTAWRIQYNGVDPETKKPIVRRTMIEPTDSGNGWTILDQVSRLDSRDWRDLGPPALWPYAWAPILHCQNLPNPGEFHGIADLEYDILLHNGNINFLASNMMRIIRNHGHPKTVAKGINNAKDMDISPDGIIQVPKDAELYNLEMQGDLASSQNYLEWLSETFGVVTRTPTSSLGTSDIGSNISGLALKIKYEPLIEKTRLKRLTYGGLADELNMAFFDLGKHQVPAAPAIIWPEMMQSDPVAERQAAKDDVQLGASQDSVLSKLGYNPDHERERRAAGDALAVAQARAAIVKALTDAGLGVEQALQAAGYAEEDVIRMTTFTTGVMR